MTMTLEEMTLAAIDKAYGEHIGKLYAVLCAASPDDVKKGLAIERFELGLEHALAMRDDAIKAAAE